MIDFEKDEKKLFDATAALVFGKASMSGGDDDLVGVPESSVLDRLGFD